MAPSGSPYSLRLSGFKLSAGDFAISLTLLLEPPVFIDGHALVLPENAKDPGLQLIRRASGHNRPTCIRHSTSQRTKDPSAGS